MKMFLKRLFSDENTINEKNVIGFLSFIVMILLALIDVVPGLFKVDIEVKEFIYDSFLILTLGTLGIGSFDKYASNKHKQHCRPEPKVDNKQDTGCING